MTRRYRHLTFEERCQVKTSKKSDLQIARLRNTPPSSPFGLHPHWEEGRVLHFQLETGKIKYWAIAPKD